MFSFFKKIKNRKNFKKDLENIFKNNINEINIKSIELKNKYNIENRYFQKEYDNNIQKNIFNICSKILNESINFKNNQEFENEIKKIFENIGSNRNKFKKEINNVCKNFCDKNYSKILNKKLNDLNKNDFEVILKTYEVLNIKMSNERIKKFENCKKLNEIILSDLKPINCNEKLQKDEICFYQVNNVNWSELKTRTEKVNYGGIRTRVKIAKGIYYTTGSVSSKSVKKENVEILDTGKFIVTNKRIIYVGKRGVKNIKHEKILDYNVIYNDLQIKKDSGKPFYLSFKDDLTSRIIAIILEKIENEY